MSWSIGGDPNATTIPGFIRTYTPNLIGASLGSHLLEVHRTSTFLIITYYSFVTVLFASLINTDQN